MKFETMVIVTVTEPDESRKYGQTQCVAAINHDTKEMRRIYPITPSEVKRLNIHRGAVLSVAIREEPKKDPRIESVKVDTSKSAYITDIQNGYLDKYASTHLVGCHTYRAMRPFKQPDPSFYFQEVHDVRARTKKGEPYWFFKCQDPDCTGHMMKIKDSEHKDLKDGDKIILGRHSQERMIYPFLVGVLND